MLNTETRRRLIDFWDAWDLVAYLQIPTEDVVDAFEDEIEEALEDIEEYMGVSSELEDDE